jgi:hypothetical protein
MFTLGKLTLFLLVPLGMLMIIMVDGEVPPSPSPHEIDWNNNIHISGCLYQKNLTFSKRVCNSEDDMMMSEQEKERFCQRTPSAYDVETYQEIRLIMKDWESTVFSTWIIQIILSELLGVPTSAETGSADPERSLNFYSPYNTFEFSTANYYKSLENAYRLKDCSHAKRTPDEYEDCGYYFSGKHSFGH